MRSVRSVDGDGISAVVSVDLEEYVASVVSAEVPSAWPKAALEAQAVAARTFAMAQKVAQGPAARFHLRASVLDQVYAQGGATEAAKEAARATHGEVLTFGEAPIAAYFSASCGGRSEAAEEAFRLPAGATPYLAGAREDEGDPDRPWTARIPLREISAALRKARRILAPVSAVSVSERTTSGRAREIALGTSGGTRRIGASELRQILGYETLPSLLFEVNLEKDSAVFRGRGSGHGVGLCQWGARGRALHGDGYRAIQERIFSAYVANAVRRAAGAQVEDGAQEQWKGQDERAQRGVDESRGNRAQRREQPEDQLVEPDVDARGHEDEGDELRPDPSEEPH